MADATAWIMVAPHSSAFGSDHFTPTHMLILSENDRASWRLASLTPQRSESITWVPSSPDTLLHDAILMTAVHVFQDEELLETASRAVPNIAGQWLDLNTLGASPELPTLYEKSRSLCWKASMVVTVLSQSSLRHLLDQFAQYAFDVRICREW
jgi:hypothetical protein